MIVVTDGQANPVPVRVAVEAAGRAKADGLRVFTIGLGNQVEVQALRSMATSAADYFSATDQSVLARIYERIAFAIPCPADRFWGHRP